MNGQSLVRLVESEGKKAVFHKLVKCMEADKGAKHKLKPTDFSIRELFEAFVGPVETHLSYGQHKQGFVDIKESAAVESSLYQVLAGRVISDMVIEGYNRISHIGDQLVTTYQSKERYDKVPGWTPTYGLKTVKEGEEYENNGFGHKFVGTGDVVKKGTILPITEEAVFHDRTGRILDQAAQLGEDARLDREKIILRGVLGLTQVYFPSDVPTSLYGAAPQLVNLNPLQDWRNIEKTEVALADTKDEEGNTILVMPMVMLVPTSIRRTAQRILNATEVRETDPTGGTTAQRTTIGANPMQGAYQIVSSPLVHQLQEAASIASSAARSSWWLGDFKKQFFWKEMWPIQTLRPTPGNNEEFRHDVVAQFKIRYYGGMFAKDFRYVSKNVIV